MLSTRSVIFNSKLNASDMTKFTPVEIDFLKHRLTVPDALHDVMVDDESDELAATSLDDVERACTNLLGRIEQGVPIDRLVDGIDPVSAFCLRDAVEGSTYVSCVQDEADYKGTPQMKSAVKRTVISVQAKLAAVGFTVDIGQLI